MVSLALCCLDVQFRGLRFIVLANPLDRRNFGVCVWMLCEVCCSRKCSRNGSPKFAPAVQSKNRMPPVPPPKHSQRRRRSSSPRTRQFRSVCYYVSESEMEKIEMLFARCSVGNNSPSEETIGRTFSKFMTLGKVRGKQTPRKRLRLKHTFAQEAKQFCNAEIRAAKADSPENCHSNRAEFLIAIFTTVQPMHASQPLRGETGNWVQHRAQRNRTNNNNTIITDSGHMRSHHQHYTANHQNGHSAPEASTRSLIALIS
ncbi:AGAP001598-PA [Anopheles gambiae str. PEST]|uniref:AGAP001598-PA n=1 Tax=Anopheles gambiae TaxID=7165 RepID=Q8T5J1_ANOGA|nr:AGAP001598-PA [Anopheles gambiae str. PEST]CAD27769.1 hypothetical protein [Anopheles gambiae]